MDVRKFITGHNLTFFNALVDLKLVGWKSYSTALDAYTLHQYSSYLKTIDEIVENVGESMKTTAAKIAA